MRRTSLSPLHEWFESKGCDLKGQEYCVECVSAVDLSDDPIQPLLFYWNFPGAAQLVNTGYQGC